MKTLKDKVAAITGAGSGIGRATAILMASKGCHLALSDVNEAGLAETVEQCRSQQGFVGFREQMQRAVEFFLFQLGLLALGDVGDDADHADRVLLLVEQYLPLGVDPA